MKVLVAQARASTHGGAEAYTAAMINTLRRMNVDVGTVDIDGHHDIKGQLCSQKIGHPGRILWNWAWVCRALPDLSKNYDAVILAFGEGPELSKPTLTIRHAPAVFETSPELLSYLGARPTNLRLAYVKTCRSIARLASHSSPDLTVANSHWTASKATQLCGCPINRVLYPPLPTARKISGQRLPFRLLSLGRITPNKRIEDAVDVVERLAQQGLPASLEVLGRANDKYAIRLARSLKHHPNVRLTLNATPDEKARALGEAAIGLHMFRAEHFGISVAEMIRAGVVPLVIDDGGVRELVTPPSLRFKTTDEASTIASTLLTRPDLRQQHMNTLRGGAAYTRAQSFEDEAEALLFGFLELGKVSYAA